METTTTRYFSTRRAIIFVIAVLFIVFGFAVDGVSEVGHHAGFILGGIGLGYGLKP